MDTKILQDQYTTNDKLSFNDYRTIIREIINETDTPLAIGIFGRWGSGKTSLLRMLLSDIEKEGKHYCAWFNAWKYERQESLWRALILRVLDVLRPQRGDSAPQQPETDEISKPMLDELDRLEENLYRAVEWNEIGDWVVDWAKAVPGTISTAAQIALYFSPGGKPLIDLLQTAYKGVTGKDVPAIQDAFQQNLQSYRREQLRSIEQFETQFSQVVEKYVTKRGKRLVVFIDDLDRCLPEKTIEVLEAIKLFLDVPGCIFVFGLDREVIQRGIEVKYNHLARQLGLNLIPISGDDYLEKMIQVPFYLPPLDEREIELLIEQLVPNFPTGVPTVFSIGLPANPRKVKRAVNLFITLRKISDLRAKANKLTIKLNDVLLAKIIVIQVRTPELFTHIAEFPVLLQSLETHFKNRTLDKPALTEESSLKSASVWNKYTNEPQYDFLSQLLTWGEIPDDFFGYLTLDQIEQYIYLTYAISDGKTKIQSKTDQNVLDVLLSGDPIGIKDQMLHIKKSGDEAKYYRVLHRYSFDKGDILKSFSAGLALGYLDEPKDAGELIPIPAGNYTLGFAEQQHKAQIGPYSIMKYLVTNQQYEEFILADGYGNQSLWTERGWMVKEREGWRMPFFWTDPIFNQPNQPVVGVSWYEAMAYAKWKKLRLPTENEWELAAHGDGEMIYPWGNNFEIRRANSKETGILRTSPIGFFTDGKSPYGVMDMSGNVWEWTSQEHQLGGMILRGGSWNDESKFATCYYQYRDDPEVRCNNIGFRLAGNN